MIIIAFLGTVNRSGEENIPQGLPGDIRIRERAVESGGGERV